MRAQLRNQLAALFLLAPAAATFTALPSPALAQPATPQVRGLDVSSDHGTYPGSRLRFVLHGSPGADAAVHIRGIQGRIPLREAEPGVYVGRYVVARGDRIDEGSPVRAILSRGNRTVTANYDLPEGLGNVARAPAPQLRIDRFDVVPVDRLTPGTELRFSLDGVPGAVATIAISGMAEIRMREVRPGHYEGAYTIKRSDAAAHPSGPIVASLRAGDRVARAELSQPLMAAARTAPAPIVSGEPRDRGREHARSAYAHVPIQILSPGNNARVDGGYARVRGRTAPLASIEVAVHAQPGQNGASQRIWEQVVRADENGDFEFNFVAPSPAPGTRYDVSMTAHTPDATSESHLVLYQRG